MLEQHNARSSCEHVVQARRMTSLPEDKLRCGGKYVRMGPGRQVQQATCLAVEARRLTELGTTPWEALCSAFSLLQKQATIASHAVVPNPLPAAVSAPQLN